MVIKATFEKKKKQDFESLIRPHLEYLYRLSYRFTGNKTDAEDLVQDLMVKLYPRRQELAGVLKLRPWLIRVLYRQFVDDKRKQKRSPLRLIKVRSEKNKENLIESIPGSEPDPEEYLQRQIFHEHLEQALKKLSRDQRAVITLHDIEDYKLNELETLLEVPMGTLKSRLHRARAKLKEILKKNGTF